MANLEHVVLPDGTVLDIPSGSTPTGLGNLAYKDSASGSFTPSGDIVVVNYGISLTKRTMSYVTSAGSLPTWIFANHRLTRVQGSLPTYSNYQVAYDYAWTNPTILFQGDSGSVSVS